MIFLHVNKKWEREGGADVRVLTYYLAEDAAECKYLFAYTIFIASLV